jgi:hypothetical protein
MLMDDYIMSLIINIAQAPREGEHNWISEEERQLAAAVRKQLRLAHTGQTTFHQSYLKDTVFDQFWQLGLTTAVTLPHLTPVLPPGGPLDGALQEKGFRLLNTMIFAEYTGRLSPEIQDAVGHRWRRIDQALDTLSNRRGMTPRNLMSW